MTFLDIFFSLIANIFYEYTFTFMYIHFLSVNMYLFSWTYKYVQCLTHHILLLSNFLYWLILCHYQAIGRLSKGSLSRDVESMRVESIQYMTECQTDIADISNRPEIHNIHVQEIHNIPLIIQSKLSCLNN